MLPLRYYSQLTEMLLEQRLVMQRGEGQIITILRKGFPRLSPSADKPHSPWGLLPDSSTEKQLSLEEAGSDFQPPLNCSLLSSMPGTW